MVRSEEIAQPRAYKIYEAGVGKEAKARTDWQIQLLIYMECLASGSIEIDVEKIVQRLAVSQHLMPQQIMLQMKEVLEKPPKSRYWKLKKGLSKKFKNSTNNRGNEGGNGGGSVKRQKEEEQDQSTVPLHEQTIFTSQLGRQKADQNFLAVEWENRNKVKDSQGNVELDQERKEVIEQERVGN